LQRGKENANWFSKLKRAIPMLPFRISAIFLRRPSVLNLQPCCTKPELSSNPGVVQTSTWHVSSNPNEFVLSCPSVELFLLLFCELKQLVGV
jgi:hypothetical protein